MSLFSSSLAEQMQPVLRAPYQETSFIKELLQPVFQGRGAQLTILAPAARELMVDLPEAAQQLASSITRYGSVQTADSRTLDLYDIQLQPGVQPERNRAGLAAMVRRLVAGNNAALATFVPSEPGPWRLSLVARDTEFKEGEFVNNDTPPKRFTFLLGPGAGGRTSAVRLAGLADAPSLTMKAVRDAFSVETLTREFYRDLSNWYFWALPQIRFNTALTGPEQAAHAASCTIKIITRVIFIWFLKEKRLVAPELFRRDVVKKLLYSVAPDDSTFYAGILQNLFFNVLNQRIPSRFQATGPEVAQASLLFQDFDRAKTYFNQSPFVNGGLFDGTTEECAHPNPALDKLRIPNRLFFGDSTADLSDTLHNPKAKKVAVHGLIDLLHSYQFTAEENTPLDQEVALDPELLGKIFENLLASYNEETQTTARKASGSFYTPREIVDYMVDESLLTYLQSQLPAVADLPALLRPVLVYHTDAAPTELSNKQTETIIEALDRLTILDPAVGSGAFPMGILQKMTRLLQVLDPKNQRWLKLVLHRLPKSLRYEMSERLQRENLDYVRKLGIIQQSIYGVDIQPVALQIAKLRFFISLIVEQRTTQNPDENFGVLPLPNLEFKFVCANTLIGLPKATNDLFDYNHLQDDLAELRDQFFKSVGTKKREVEKAFKAKQNELAGRLLDERSRAFQLATWEPFKEKSSPWFDAEWMFGVKGGFDLVIGNPPYVQLQKMKESSRVLATQGYRTYTATGDLYGLFYEQGVNLLRAGGLLCFITSNTWLKSGYGGVLRNYFARYTNPLQLINFSKVQVFEGVTVNTNILLTEKANNSQSAQACLISNDYSSLHNLSLYFQQRALPFPTPPSEQAWVVLTPLELQILRKIEAAGTPLKNWNVKIYRGILTGFNDAFIVDEQTKNQLLENSPESAEIIRPILRGRDIKQYRAQFANQWLLNTHNGQPSKGSEPINVKRDYPHVLNHLLKHRDILQQRQDRGKDWTNLRNCAYLDDFAQEKIVWIELTDKPKFALDTEGYFLNNTIFFMTGPSLKYLLGFLNSCLSEWYFDKIAATSGAGTRRWIKMYIDQIRVPMVSEAAQRPIIALVNEAVDADTADERRLKIKLLLDEEIFRLLGLSTEEISFIQARHSAG